MTTLNSEEKPDLDIKSILLLDDDIELADTIKLLLESRNYVVTVVHNGVEGLHEVMAMDFDVIMCDIMMPRMAGDMFYRAVERTKPQLLDRFIFITGHADNPRVTEFLKSINAVVLLKPVKNEELVRTISYVLNGARNAVAGSFD
jgi:CheY-like chemotaxis protein